MPIFKYFLYVGPLLSVLLFAWSAYLKPPTSKAQETLPPAELPEQFRPTSAPPIVEAEQLSVGGTAGPSMGSERPHHGARVARSKKKQRTQVAARPRAAPDRSFAYFPQRPVFFDWRWQGR
jgi:hypothetical protein